MTDALFALPESADSLAPMARQKPEKLSPDRARTERQRLAIAAGRHPLDAVFPTRRHPDTIRKAYERTDERGRPLTCGTCSHRELMGAGNRTVAKCTATRHAGEHDSRTVMPRATGSAASDVRAWWPACTEYSGGTS
jgi:hypothetical protein